MQKDVRLQGQDAGQVSVGLDASSPYGGPSVGSWRDRLRYYRLLVAYRPYRRLLRRYLDPSRPLRIAEVGCGPGYLLAMLQRWYPCCQVVGIDYDARVLENAARRARGAVLLQSDAEALPARKGTFAAIISLHTVEHLYSPERFVGEAKRVLEPKGLLIVATPNPQGIGARVMGTKWSGWRQDHVSLKGPQEWIDLVEQQGFVLLTAGTTMLSGIPALRRLPLALVNYAPLVLLGTLPWHHGEALVAAFRACESDRAVACTSPDRAPLKETQP